MPNPSVIVEVWTRNIICFWEAFPGMLGGMFSGLGGGILAVGAIATLVGAGMFFAAILDEQSNQDEERECGLLSCRDGPDEGRTWLNSDLAQVGWSVGGFGLVCIVVGALIAGTGRGLRDDEARGRA